MKQPIIILLLFFATNILFAQQKEIKVAFYNVENLFDTKNDPSTQDEDFLPNSKSNWTNERLSKKIADLAKVISDINPVLMGLAECENRATTKKMCQHPSLKHLKLDVIQFDSPDERGIDVALIYNKKKFHPIHKQAYKLELKGEKDTRTRDVLLVEGEISSDTFVVLVNHWPSRRHGDDQRFQAAQLVKKITDSISIKAPNKKIIVMGDLNDEPHSPSIAQQLKVAQNFPPAADSLLYDPFADYSRKKQGSYCHKGTWNQLDHIIMNQNIIFAYHGYKYVNHSAAIFKKDYVLESDAKYRGQPFRTYVGDKYIGGVSDHFAVYVTLSWQ